MLWVPARLLQYKLSVIHMLGCSDHPWISGRRLLCSVDISEHMRRQSCWSRITVNCRRNRRHYIHPPSQILRRVSCPRYLQENSPSHLLLNLCYLVSGALSPPRNSKSSNPSGSCASHLWYSHLSVNIISHTAAHRL